MTTLTIEHKAEIAAGATGMGLDPRQQTVAQTVKIKGTGLHSGREAVVTLHPAEEGCGIVFRSGGARIPARATCVSDTSRGTTISADGCSVRTIEHLMSALRGMGVDNALVEVSGEELPALDGSALPYCDAIASAGVVSLSGIRKPVELTEPVCVSHNGSFIVAVPAQRLKITYVMNYDHPLIGSQSASYVLDEGNFVSELAPARTFVLYEEVADLLSQDLARGGSFDNAIVLWRDRLSSDLRFPDELARHKLVDMVGDLALVGGLLHAEIVAVKSGHTLNVEFAREALRKLNQC